MISADALTDLIASPRRDVLSVALDVEPTKPDQDEPPAWRIWFGSSRPPTFTRRAGTGASRGVQCEPFEDRAQEHCRRLWRGPADAAGRWLQETGVDRLIIAGPEEATSAVRAALPEAGQEKHVAVVPTPPDPGAEELYRLTAPAARQEEAHDRALVEAIVGRAIGEAGTVVGIRPTLEALAQERVPTVAADRDVEAAIIHCGRCGHATACRALPPLSAAPRRGYLAVDTTRRLR